MIQSMPPYLTNFVDSVLWCGHVWPIAELLFIDVTADFTVQMDKDPRHIPKATQELLKTENK